MVVQLACVPADVRAGDLAIIWNGTLPPVLAESLVTRAEGILHLGVIGASHVITVDGPKGQFREEISCTARQDPEAVHPLPADIDRSDYHLTTSIDVLGSKQFAELAEGMLAAGEEWLVVSFPGIGGHHLTALRGMWDHDAWRWETFHFYPDELTVVSTRSWYRP